MRKTLLAGLLLAVAAVVVVWLSTAFGLDLESVALLGAALGAVVALVPDRAPVFRLVGFGSGFLAAWIGYLVRAGMLPDTAYGRAVAVGLVVALCVGITAASGDRLPLWSTLLGTAALSGAYEFTYAAAPPEVMTTSVSTATTLLFNVAVGFVAAAVVAPAAAGSAKTVERRPRPTKNDGATNKLDDFMMETSK
jgi:hypothetical protein